MTSDEHDKLYARLEAVQARERAELEEKHARQREALEVIGPDLFEVLITSASPERNGTRRNYTKIIADLMPELQAPIDINSVIGELRSRFQMADINPTSISGALRKLSVPDGPLKVLVEGSGRRATTYERRIQDKTKATSPQGDGAALGSSK